MSQAENPHILYFSFTCVFSTHNVCSYFLFTLSTVSCFCCFCFTYTSANSNFSFRLLCFTQALLGYELLFSLSRSSELLFSSGTAFLLILVIVRQWLFTLKALNFECYCLFLIILVTSQIENKHCCNKPHLLAVGASRRQRRAVGNKRWMCRSASIKLGMQPD